MPVPFIMPKFDMDQERAKIASWEKHDGEWVQADEVVLVVETDKVAIEVPAPASGRLAGIRYQAGDEVAVTTVIAYILKDGEALPGAPEPARATTAANAAAPAATPVAVRAAQALGVNLAEVPAAGKRVRRDDVERYAARHDPPARGVQGAAQPVGPAPGRVAVAATPAARRLARELEAPLGEVPGRGPRGRVQAADVIAFREAQAARMATAMAPTGRPAEIVPLTGMRQTIAERMQASFHDAPHIALTLDVDAGALEACRARLSALAEREGAAKVSLTALLVKCAAWALRRHPYLNASLQAGSIYLWQDINIGVATALEPGLIVPVIRQADARPVREIARALHDLTTRAKAGRLGLADVQHGTFTLSNLGMFGIHHFRAIINPPESAILAVGRVMRKPVVINAQDEIAVRPMLTLTLSADHRVVDGVTAARFLTDLAQALEAPDTLLY
jgi:pyruvate dehydrogenase E2 component (dihydrolipoamide acetyltransferase)